MGNLKPADSAGIYAVSNSRSTVGSQPRGDQTGITVIYKPGCRSRHLQKKKIRRGKKTVNRTGGALSRSLFLATITQTQQWLHFNRLVNTNFLPPSYSGRKKKCINKKLLTCLKNELVVIWKPFCLMLQRCKVTFRNLNKLTVGFFVCFLFSFWKWKLDLVFTASIFSDTFGTFQVNRSGYSSSFNCVFFLMVEYRIGSLKPTVQFSYFVWFNFYMK